MKEDFKEFFVVGVLLFIAYIFMTGCLTLIQNYTGV